MLYVGRAQSLRSRVRQYWQAGRAAQPLRIETSIDRVVDVEYTVTDTLSEALLLEATLIKRHQPRFNVRLKDDKSYPYIKVTLADDFPRVERTRKLPNDGSRYFGPYASASSVDEAMNLIRRLFPFRTCTIDIREGQRTLARPCLLYHIKRCQGPCIEAVSKADYRADIEQVMLFLEGRQEQVGRRLRQEMADASAGLDYERAAALRDKLRAIERTMESQKMAAFARADTDVLGFAREVFAIRAANPVLRRRNFFLHEARVPGQGKDLTWLSPGGTEMTEEDWCRAKVADLEDAILALGSVPLSVLEERMAKTPERVYDLLERLWAPARAVAAQEAADLQAAVEADGHTFRLEPWDWRYYAEKVKRARYDLDENELRPYFTLENVREGAFYVANRLYGLTFEERTDLPKYHEEARTFEVKDTDGSHLGVFVVDFHPRPGKRAGAWSSAYRRQHVRDGVDVRPVVVNVCNFTRPVAGQPALLRLDEVETLFHEFGHALHALLAQIRYRSLAGVPRDFVELPSQILEHWATEPEVLAVYARHWQTGAPIPGDLVERIRRAERSLSRGSKAA